MKKILVLFTLVICIGGFFFLIGDSNGEKEASVKIPFKTAKVVRGKMVVKVSATGVVEPNFQVEVKSKASGEVLGFSFEEGDRINKGKLLLRLDKSDEIRNVSRAEANLDSAKANLEKARSSLNLQKTRYATNLKSSESQVEEAEANLIEARDKLKRQEDLFNKKFTSQESLDQARTAYKVNEENLVQAKTNLQAARDGIHDIDVKKHDISLAQAEVDRSKIELAEAEERLEETEIYAPIHGVLIEKLVQEGQIISSGISNVSGGTPLATLADLSKLFIMADVDETDIGQIRVGQKVTITTDAYPSDRFDGKVTRIAPKGKVENSITIFKAKIEILGKGRDILKPMMSANVDIINKELADALYLPREAVFSKKGTHYAAILVNETPQEVPVELGVYNPISIQVNEGLDADQEVLIGDWREVWEEHKKGNDNSSSIFSILSFLR